MITVFICSHCKKELSILDREYCSKNDLNTCSECRYLSLIGIVTISDYNLWLRGSFPLAKNKLP